MLPAQQTPDRLKFLVEIDVNYGAQIMKKYEEEILPLICKEGDDGQYGSSAVCDIQALQALSKRIHYGTFVAESKFLAQTEEYTKLIKAGDRAGIMELLTNREVEERVIKRVQNKAMAYGQEITDDTSLVHGSAIPDDMLKHFKVNPESMGRLYRDIIIPLTKDVEVDYLMKRVQ